MKKKIILLLFVIGTLATSNMDAFWFGGRRGGFYLGLGTPFWGGYRGYPYRYSYGYPYGYSYGYPYRYSYPVSYYVY